MGDLLIVILMSGISDFIIQKDSTVEKRNSDNIREIVKGNLIHFVDVFIPIVLSLGIIYTNILNIIIYSVIYASIHIIIDILKCALNKYTKLDSIFLFCIDQVLHILTYVVIWKTVDFKFNSNIYNLLSINFNNNKILGVLIFITISVYVIYGGKILVKMILDNIQSSSISNENESVVNNEAAFDSEITVNTELSSVYIGMLERLITLILVIKGRYDAIAFIFAAKSLARTKKLDDDNFANIYIVGTMLSILIGIIGGEIFNILY